MPLPAIGLLLCSALLHTTWNYLLKGSGDKTIATWWVTVMGAGLSLIALFFTGLPPRQLWPFVFFSVLVEAVYFLTLAAAYQQHDFSLIYPMARGAAPAFLLLWSLVLLGERPTVLGMIGLGLIVGGLGIMGINTLLEAQERSLHLKGIGLALATALFISIYTAIDGTAVKQGPAPAYAFLIFVCVPLPVTPFILKRYRWPQLKREWITYGARLPLISALGIGSYLLALWAYSFAPLSYSGAIREVSVVLGAFAGWQFLKEKLGGVRVAGAVIIFGGILMIALYG